VAFLVTGSSHHATALGTMATDTNRAMMKMRGKLMQAGKTGKMILGAVMVALAALILSGVDKSIEAWLVNNSPAWITKLTTRF
jgi:hypothetical protein